MSDGLHSTDITSVGADWGHSRKQPRRLTKAQVLLVRSLAIQQFETRTIVLVMNGSIVRVRSAVCGIYCIRPLARYRSVTTIASQNLTYLTVSWRSCMVISGFCGRHHMSRAIARKRSPTEQRTRHLQILTRDRFTIRITSLLAIRRPYRKRGNDVSAIKMTSITLKSICSREGLQSSDRTTLI